MPAHLLSEDNLVIVTLQPNLAEPELTKVDAALETSLPVIVLGTKRPTIIGFVRTTRVTNCVSAGLSYAWTRGEKSMHISCCTAGNFCCELHN